MKTHLFPSFAALVALLCLCGAAPAQFIDIRVSIKVIHNPAGGAPVNSSMGYGTETLNLISDTNITTQIDFSNAVFATYGRGLRFVLSEPIQDIQPMAPAGEPADYWYELPAGTPATRDKIEAAARADTQNVWRWRNDSINYYINNTSAGFCSFPSENHFTIVGGSISYRAFFLHECGHFFELNHTHDSQSGTAAGDDGVADTLPDRDNWTRDQIAMNSFGGNYADLNSTQQSSVDNTWFNVMSYHVGSGNPTDRFTSDQLDIICNNVRSTRAAVCASQPHFVDWRNSGFQPRVGFSFLGIGGAYGSWSEGYTRAAVGDTLLIRPGTYHTGTAPLVKAITIRATRGDVRLEP